MISIAFAYQLIILFLALSLLLKNAEYLATLSQYAGNGVFSFRVVGSDNVYKYGYGQFFERLYSKTGLQRLLLVSIVAGASLIITGLGSQPSKPILLLFLLVNLIINYRHRYGLDGADQMNVLVIFTLLFCYLPFEDASIRAYGLYFLAVQLVLAYFVAGAAKAISSAWRDGTAIRGVLSTNMFGSPVARSFVYKSKYINIALGWLVILFEVLFPLTLLLSDPTTILVLMALAFVFHLINAFMMGLNDFVWSFLSVYPAFYFLCMSI